MTMSERNHPRTPFDKWTAAGRPKKRKAEVLSIDKAGMWVGDEFGQRVYFVKGSIHYPGTHPVGTKGTIEYRTSANYGLDWFEPEGKKK